MCYQQKVDIFNKCELADVFFLFSNCNKMGNIWATADLSDDFVHELINETGFTRKQINRLYIRFRHLDKAKKGYLVKEDLAIVPAVRFSILTKIFLLYHSALF